MNISQAFPSNFLKADDLQGKPVIVSIASAEFEDIGQGRDKERKIILGFTGKEKRMVVNKTNASTIAKLYGDETDGWIGQKITLMPREVEFQGEMVLAIRVSLQKPGAPTAAPTPRPQGPRPQGPRTPDPEPQPDAPPANWGGEPAGDDEVPF